MSGPFLCFQGLGSGESLVERILAKQVLRMFQDVAKIELLISGLEFRQTCNISCQKLTGDCFAEYYSKHRCL